MENETLPTQEIPADKYTPKAGEWFTEDEGDEAMGVETFHYENGGKSKRCTLSTGAVAISRRLKGNSRIAITRIVGKDTNKIQDAVVAVSTKIDGKDIVMEDLDNLWYDDLMKVQTMAASINFL